MQIHSSGCQVRRVECNEAVSG